MDRRRERRGLAELRRDERIRVMLFGALSEDGLEAYDGPKFVLAGAVLLRVEVHLMWRYVVAAAALLRGARC